MTKTVFVIGAGASTEFGPGMPIGSELAEAIELQLDHELVHGRAGPISDALRMRGFDSADTAAMQRVRDGIVTKESIDDFVEEWRDFPKISDVARVAISHAILEGESHTLWGNVAAGLETPQSVLRKTRTSWLGQILRFHNGRSSRRSFAQTMGDIGFVVFNYDRLVEYHLYHHLTVGLGVGQEEAREVLNSFPIIHVYGAIGSLPELGGDQPFGKSSPRTLLNSSKMIRTYTDAVESLTGERILNLVSSAHRVVFLGAAYHPLNISILFPNNTQFDQPTSPEIFGTLFGMRGPKQANISAKFSNPYKPLRLADLKAGAFIDNFQDDLFA